MISIYVVAHKPVDVKLPENYNLMQVNAENNGVFCALNDAIGTDNISKKNPYFCELTAAYWIWKNDKTSDIVGLAHYRRFLVNNRFSTAPKHFINEKNISKDLKKYDCIATRPYKTHITQKEHLLQSVREKDFLLLRETLVKLYPDYAADFDAVFNGHESYLLNMFIGKKKLWDEYCQWLFTVLFEMEKSVDMTGYSVQEKRLYGYLSERLFTVYARHNGLKIKSYSTCTVGESKVRIAIQKIQRMIGIRN